MKCSEATLAGVAPGTVQPSRLRSSLRLFLSLTFSLLVSSSLLPLSPVQQKCLSLEGYTVSNPGQRPGIADGKERLAWRAIRPRRWRHEPQREGALCVDEDGLKAHTSLLQADSSLLPAASKKPTFLSHFRRFDINIFNFREHFSPSNFAYSACSFALPSPNLN